MRAADVTRPGETLGGGRGNRAARTADRGGPAQAPRAHEAARAPVHGAELFFAHPPQAIGAVGGVQARDARDAAAGGGDKTSVRVGKTEPQKKRDGAGG